MLIDTGKQTVLDAQEELNFVKKSNYEVFFAIPETEAWLFADIDSVRKLANSEAHLDTINRLPFPEEIPHPKQLAYYLLREKNSYTNKGDFSNYDYLENIDISIATARCPSLSIFLNKVGHILNSDTSLIKEKLARNINRKIFSNLLKEVMPIDTIVYRTLRGEQITAQDMIRNIEEGNELGRDYTSDLLRIARDLLKREAQKSK